MSLPNVNIGQLLHPLMIVIVLIIYTNRLHADLHFSTWSLRLGYNNDILTYYATPNHFQYVSHNFVIGFTGNLMGWSKSNENKKIKTALYTY
jgi:hypothetical protein